MTESAGPWDTTLLVDDDGEYFCRVLLHSDGIRFVPEAKVYYRATGRGSLSYVGRSSRKMEAQWRSMQLHIGYLRSLEDSPRVRAACIAYLQNWVSWFYPDRLDIFQQAEDTARALGGRLEIPPLSWKYAWIRTAFGWELAKRAQVGLPELKRSVVRSWDKALFRLQNRFKPAPLV